MAGVELTDCGKDLFGDNFTGDGNVAALIGTEGIRSSWVWIVSVLFICS